MRPAGSSGNPLASTRSPAPTRRFWPSFRLRTLLIIVLAVGGGLGWLVHRAHTQRDIVAAIVRSGGKVYYDWELREISTKSGSFLNPDPNAKPRWPKWLLEALGPDFLCDVRVVYLGRSNIDAVLASVGRLKRLDGLHVSRSGLTDAGMAHLYGLDQLRNLMLQGNSKITRAGLENLRGMARLERLGIYDATLADDALAPLEALVNVRYLSLRNAGITSDGLAHLRGMTRLTMLVLDGSRIEDLAPIRHLTGLTALSLERSPITDAGLAAVAGFTKLEGIRLDRDLRLTDAGMAHLQGLSNLTGITLSYTQVGDAGLLELSRLTRLGTLRLNNTRITDAGLVYLARLPALVTLDLFNTQVGDAGLAELSRSPSLQSLNLQTTQVTDAGMTHLAGLKTLRGLGVQKTKVTDEGIARLKKALPQLRARR